MLLGLLQLIEQQVNRFLSNPYNLFSLPPLLLLIFLIKWLSPTPTASTTQKNLPPSPPTLPIIGNFHQLGKLPYRSLSSLAQRYGPLMLLRLGKMPTLVVSSPEAAREIMKTHDLTFANRPDVKILKRLFGENDVVVSPYGEHWKQLKSIFVHQLLSKKRVQSFRSVREEEIHLMMRKISESCSTSPSSSVDLRDMFVTLSNDVGCRAAFGRKYTGGENGEKLMYLLAELFVLVGKFCIGDYVPWLGWLDRLNGTVARVEKVAKGLDEFFESVIEERLSAQLEISPTQVNLDQENEDFMDILLKIEKNDTTGISLDRPTIKAMILDAFVGGTDSTSTFLEWAMAELLRNPNSLKKLENEVRLVLNGKHDVSEDDLEKMVFLKAVIKETYRLHPPIPLNTRSPKIDIKVMGYDVAAGTMVLINNWYLANDPKLWDRPNEFRPERFLEESESIDFKGHDYEFLPFGAGRRLCPGMYFASVLIEYVLANIVHKFNWELPRHVKAEELDMTECLGAVIHRKVPLRATATPLSS